MNLINSVVEIYTETYTSKQDDVLDKIYQDSLVNHPHSDMMSSKVQGKFLEVISYIKQPKYILEIGTFTGYSAICLAKGLKPDGELHTIELREEDANIAWKNFTFADFNKKIRLHNGNALHIIPQLDYEWDLVFIDADKIGYIEYYEMVLPRLNINGVIVADNVLFHGEVLKENITGKNAKAIDAFNKHVANDERTEQVIVTLRDGLMLIKKIK